MHVRLQHPAEPRKMRLRMCNAGVIEILSQSSGVHLIRGQFGYRKLLYYKDFPGMSKPVFMVSVCSSVKIKGRDCGTINGHDESSSIRTLMKDAREVLVR